MLTNNEFNNLWENYFLNIFNNTINEQDYIDYVVRENMFEDYLDIFRGKNTRNTRENRPNEWYYEHPFFLENGNARVNKNTIKYILIGEACPLNGINFFYNINEINNRGQVYLRAIYNAQYPLDLENFNWNRLNNTDDKINRLIDLAERGVLLIDIFPFSLNYQSVRQILNNLGTTSSFFNNLQNPFNLCYRINNLTPLISNDWDFCFVAPNVISEFIVDTFRDVESCFNIGNRNGKFSLLLPTNLRRNNWQKVAVDTSGNPNSALISLAFN